MQLQGVRVRRNGTLVARRSTLDFTDSSTVSWASVADDTGNKEVDVVGTGEAAIVLAGWVDPSFGNGSDGDVTLGSNTTLTRDMQYNTLDLAGFTLTTDGYRVRCRRLKNSTGSGQIVNSGQAATGRIGGGGTNARTLGNGTSGGSGGVAAAGAAGAARTNSWPATITGGNAGDGGAGGASGAGQAGGAGGSATAVSLGSSTNGYGGTWWMDLTWQPNILAVNGGAGGGGGGGASGSTPGGGGGGGGVVAVHAHTMEASVTTLSIHADGGNAGNASLGAQAGGGGGGGGGYVKLVYQVAEGGLPTLSATAGSAGTGLGSGSAGSAGNDGLTEAIQQGT